MRETAVPKAVRDLVLWDVLWDEGASAAATIDALHALADVEDAKLFALLSGPLERLAAHREPPVRAAAAAALDRATGHAGACALTRLLDDEDAEVRQKAAASAARHTPVLTALALLHRRADVRQILIDHPSAVPWDELAYLLADAHSAPLVRARLDRSPKDARIARTVLRARAAGLMAAEEARARLEALDWEHAHQVIPALRFSFSVTDKDLEKPESIDAALARPWMKDSLTEILDLCATRDGALDDDTPFSRAIVRACQRGRLGAHEHRRLALALLQKALTLGAGSPRLLAVAFCAAPGAVHVNLPEEQRRRALAACVDVIPPEQAGKAKRVDLPRALLIVDAKLHVRATAGAMRLVSPDPYRALTVLEPDRPRLLAAIEQSARDAAALLALPPQSHVDRTAFEELVRQVLALPLGARALALLTLSLPHQAFGALEALERAHSGLAEEVVVALVDVLARRVDAASAAANSPPSPPVSDDDPDLEQRLQRVSGVLAKQIPVEALPRLVADVVTHADGGAGRGRVGPLVSALVRAAGPTHARAIVLGCRPRGERALLDALDEIAMSARLERAFAAAFTDSDDERARTWARVRLEPRSEPLTLEDDSAQALRSATDAEVREVLIDARYKNLEGVSPVLLDRATLPRDPVAAASALCLGYPLHQTAALFQRIVVEEPPFLAAIDAVLLTPGGRADLPVLATAWMHAHPLHAARFDWVARSLSLGGLVDLACELPAPLVALKIAEGVRTVARQWAVARPALFERHASTHLAELCAALLSGKLRARPAEAGTSRLDATPALRVLATDLFREAARLGARGRGFVDEVKGALDKAGPLSTDVLDDELAALLAPTWIVKRPSATGAGEGAAPPDAAAASHSAASAASFDDAVARHDVSAALAVACAESQHLWLDPDRLARLVAIADSRRLALALATSPHPAAYTKSVYALDALLRAEAPGKPDDAAREALLSFLRAGDDRNLDLRRFAAESCTRVGLDVRFLWLRGLFDDVEALDLLTLFREHGRELSPDDWHRVLASAGVGGSALDPHLLAILRTCPLDGRVGARVAKHLLLDPDLEDEDARELFAWIRRARPFEDPRVFVVKEALRWGVLQGRKLLGRPIGVELIHDSWGYTKLGTPRVHINPLPILRGERHGDEVVRGLLVHEIGHQVYHSDAESRRIWDEAAKQKLHNLLNLVADEHLERNLRSVSAEYGDHLKTLCSHAFQHANHETNLEQLLDTLGARAFSTLSRSRPMPGLRWNTVRIDVGRLLKELAAAGGSFARFVRALRQGLGLREADEKAKQGLALFSTRAFRSSTMADLRRITDELVRIFGHEIEILSAVGLHEVMESGERDLLAEGLTPEELKELNQRPRTNQSRGRPVFNKGEDERFDVIEELVPLAHEPAAHRAVALQVRRGSSALRRAFDELGLQAVVERRRLTGRSLDRVGLGSAIARRDPRLLVKRTLSPAPDLFVGVVVDCSGSMQQHNAIERARAFATLIAEAARGLRGVDVHTLGFTDRVIYDAGNQERCAAHALAAGGGNNDAAGLWHASQIAKLSKRRARLLVMVSDGLPTECTMSSLRALVQRLERQGTCCAQVAVRPLAERAFRHYVEILDDDVDAAARRFAAVVMRLVKSTVR